MTTALLGELLSKNIRYMNSAILQNSVLYVLLSLYGVYIRFSKAGVICTGHTNVSGIEGNAKGLLNSSGNFIIIWSGIFICVSLFSILALC